MKERKCKVTAIWSLHPQTPERKKEGSQQTGKDHPILKRRFYAKKSMEEEKKGGIKILDFATIRGGEGLGEVSRGGWRNAKRFVL